MAHMEQYSSIPFPGRRAPGSQQLGARFAGLLVLCVTLGACSGVKDRVPSFEELGGIVTPYKVDILQGNVVTREQAQALQPGQSREQVRGMLGTPLLTSVFHADRWDYVFTFRRQGQPAQQRHLTVFFKGDVLDRTESDDLPSEAEFVSSLDSRRKTDKLPALEASEEQLKRFQQSSAAQAVPQPQAETGGAPVTAYPPLETSGSGR